MLWRWPFDGETCSTHVKLWRTTSKRHGTRAGEAGPTWSRSETLLVARGRLFPQEDVKGKAAEGAAQAAPALDSWSLCCLLPGDQSAGRVEEAGEAGWPAESCALARGLRARPRAGRVLRLRALRRGQGTASFWRPQSQLTVFSGQPALSSPSVDLAPCLWPLLRHQEQCHKGTLIFGQVFSSATISTGSFTRQTP